MKIKYLTQELTILLLFSIAVPVFTQSDSVLLHSLAEENKKSVEALVLYPPGIRLAILEACTHPEIIIKMQDMRDKTSGAFRVLIEDFPRSTQADFYDLSRYPNLIESLVLQKGNPVPLKKLLEVLPENKRADAYETISTQMPTLHQINDLNRTSQQAFQQLIAPFSVKAKQSFETLLALPEVLDLLNEDLRFTVIVGDTYRENPDWVIKKTDSLSLAVARAQGQELEDWKSDLENDPLAKAELETAATEYATENSLALYDSEGNDLFIRAEEEYAQYYFYAYPYWYGYPWWEPAPRWHPYPWWWDWGGYFYQQNMVLVFLPSAHFMNWYFDHPQHHNHYNHLSTHFVNHYQQHSRSGTPFTTSIREWRGQNQAVISESFLNDKDNLPKRLKEFGRFEESYQEYTQKNPRKPVTKADFFDKNSKKYPVLREPRNAAKIEIQQKNEVKQNSRTNWTPAKEPVNPQKTPQTVRPTPRTPLPNKETPTTRQPAPIQRPSTNPNEAKEYHRQKWEETKPQQQQTPKNNTAPRPNNTVPSKSRNPPMNPKSRGGGGG